jgi:hypothetical protein
MPTRKRRGKRNVSPEWVHWYRTRGAEVVVGVQRRRHEGEIVDEAELDRLLAASWQTYQALPDAAVIDLREWVKQREASR